MFADLYGAQHYGQISGMLALLLTLARAGAPIGASAAYIWLQGYTPLLWLAMVLFGGAIAALLLIVETQQA